MECLEWWTTSTCDYDVKCSVVSGFCDCTTAWIEGTGILGKLISSSLPHFQLLNTYCQPLFMVNNGRCYPMTISSIQLSLKVVNLNKKTRTLFWVFQAWTGLRICIWRVGIFSKGCKIGMSLVLAIVRVAQ